MAISTGSFARNFAWLLGSEGLVRITRLGTAVVLARYLSAAEFGIAALAIASHELLRLLAQNGFGLRLIRASDDDVDALCNTLYVLNWIWSLALFGLQCAVSWLVADYYDVADVRSMLLVLAVIYLTMPLGLTQMYRVQREQRLKVTAWVDSSQVMVDNVLTAVFAIAGFGAWAIVLPKLIVAPIWVIGYRVACNWRFDPGKGFKRFGEAFAETRSLLSAELARGLRAQMDIFIIGRLLGTEALGLYYFARNAGLGISLALLQAASHAMLPKLGEVVRRFGIGSELQSESLRILRLMLAVTLPIIAAQVFLAPYYVPLVFGNKWLPAVPVLMLLCLSAVPRLVGESMTQLARAAGHASDDARWNILSTPVFLCVVLVGCYYGLTATALSLLLFHLVYQSLFVIATGSRLFRKRPAVAEPLQATT
ncbi:MAG: oligosaccharide flippase family protein [Gammaproteobacteria bacterium]|nr:oligosaccharide flippase family protein [Gammaproteobacteria bacterium]